ncbi:MAG: metal ABC transporter substrate-binding protein [Armatimonadetes bacterium]|nr:metal ABC transporter substrate-binding protein [Armatimonadota bacterium]
MKPKTLNYIIAAVSLVLLPQSISSAALPPRCTRLRYLVYVAATNPTLADIANQVGGRRVYTRWLLKADQDITSPKLYESMAHVVREAEVLVRLGASYDPWIETLVDKARNKSLVNVDASTGTNAAQADSPMHGSEYWLSPSNAKIIAANIRDGLTRFSPKDAPYFAANYERFCRKVADNLINWRNRLAAHKGASVASCCNNLDYLRDIFQFDQVGTLESAHGSEQPQSLIDDLAKKLTAAGRCRIVVTETACPVKSADTVASRTGSAAAEIPSSVSSQRQTRDYFDLLDSIVNAIGNPLDRLCR